MFPSWLCQILLPISGVLIALQLMFRQYRARYYSAHAPREPEPEEGRIYPLKVSGDTVFVTDDEKYWFDKRSWWTIAIPALLGILGVFANRGGN
jgi:hypothetical protein